MTKSKFPDFTFIILIIIFLLTRLVILIFSDLSRYQGMYYELYPGMIANGIIEDKIFNLAYWNRGVSFYGGPVVTGFIVVPFFILLGKTLFSLRIVSLIISLLSFALTYKILNNFINRRTAIFASILYIFPPILFFAFSTMNYGHHAAVIIFNLIVLFLFYKIFFTGVQDNKQYQFILLGLIGGFGSYFLISHFIVISVVLFFWYIFDKRIIFKKNFYLFLLSFILGFLPWITISHFESAMRFEKPLEFVWLSQIRNILSILGYRFLKYFFFLYKSLFSSDVSDKIDIIKIFPGINDKLYSIYFAIFLVAYLFCIWHERHSFKKLFFLFFSFKRSAAKSGEVTILLPVLVLPICFIFIYSLTTGKGTSQFASRYLMPLYPFMFMIIAVFLDFLSRRKWGVLICGCIITFSIMTFLSITVPGLRYQNILNLFKFRGYGYHLYHKIFRLEYDSKNVKNFLDKIKNADRAYKPEIYCGLSYYYSKKGAIAIANLEKEYLPFFYQSLGYHNGYNLDFLKRQNKKELREILKGKYSVFYSVGAANNISLFRYENFSGQSYPNKVLHKIYESVGFYFCLNKKSPFVFNQSEKEYIADMYRGIGTCYGMMSAIPSDYRYIQYLGTTIEWIYPMYKMRYSDKFKLINTFIEKLPEQQRKYFYWGRKQGVVAMRKILKACQYDGAFDILKRDRLMQLY